MRAEMVVLLRERRVLTGSIMRWVLLRRRELGWRSDQLASELSWRSDQLASAGELLGARVTAIGEQAEVPDAVEALGQHVHEEPANELARLERHGSVAVRAFEAIVLVFERDAGKRRRGKIIVVGSIGGLIGLPFIGHYSASKFALNGFIEALRLEVSRFGIDATILHPGDFSTAISTNQVRARNATSESCYGETFEKIVDRYDRNVRTARSPHVVARKVEKLLRRKRMPARCIVGTPIEVLAVRLKAAIPGRGFEDLFRRF